MPFIHHRCNTLDEFKYSIKRWKTKSFFKIYPILYLGFHGEPGLIIIGKTKVTLDELADLLGDTCSKSVIHFGSCSTLDYHKARINTFMRKTKVLAVMGYRQDVDWLMSTSFEILLLELLQANPLDSRGINAFEKSLKEYCSKQIKQLNYRLLINKDIHFVRSRS